MKIYEENKYYTRTQYSSLHWINIPSKISSISILDKRISFAAQSKQENKNVLYPYLMLLCIHWKELYSTLLTLFQIADLILKVNIIFRCSELSKCVQNHFPRQKCSILLLLEIQSGRWKLNLMKFLSEKHL